MSAIIVITGASRGIGRACAVAFAKHLSIPTLRLCLLARCKDGLRETSELASAAAASVSTMKKDVQIKTHVIDLCDLDNLEESIQKIFLSFDTDNDWRSDDFIKISKKDNDNELTFDKAILVNNAGSLEPLGLSAKIACNVNSLSELRKSVDFNITSSMWISSFFLNYFKTRKLGLVKNCAIVNMSSLCAIEPFKTMGVYCATKASRDMFHSVMGKEEDPVADGNKIGVKILNYAPGPIDTQMVNDLIESDALDSEVSSFFKTSRKEETLIQPSATAQRLVDLVWSDEYESGKHIDYYSLDPTNKENI